MEKTKFKVKGLGECLCEVVYHLVQMSCFEAVVDQPGYCECPCEFCDLGPGCEFGIEFSKYKVFPSLCVSPPCSL